MANSGVELLDGPASGTRFEIMSPDDTTPRELRFFLAPGPHGWQHRPGIYDGEPDDSIYRMRRTRVTDETVWHLYRYAGTAAEL